VGAYGVGPYGIADFGGPVEEVVTQTTVVQPEFF